VKRILLIMPLAMGDLLMTTPLLEGLRAGYPQARLEVLANGSYARVLAHNPAVDDFRAFPYLELYQFANLPAGQAPAAALTRLAEFIDRLPADYDWVINPCYNDLAGALTFLSRGRRVLGADFTQEGYLILRGDWPTYLHLIFDEPAFNALHTADLHCLAAGVRSARPGLVFFTTEKDEQTAAQMLAGLGCGPQDKLIALHAGATRAHKRWPIDHFVALGKLLLAQGLKPVLTGGAGEAAEAARAAADIGPGALSAAGLTEDLGVLAALLRRCQALVSNDSGPIHLAAALKVPVASISLGKVQFRATGPYLPGSLALEPELACAPCAEPEACPNHLCLRTIRPVDVWAGVQHLLGGPFQRPPESRTRFFQAAVAVDGFLDWRALSTAEQDQRIYAAFRRAWLKVLRPGAEISGPPDPPPPSCRIEPWAGFDLLAGRAVAALEKMLAAVKQGRPAALAPLSGELTNLSHEIKALGIAEPLLKPLVIYLIHRRASLDDPGLEPQLAKQLSLYQQVQRVARLAAQGLARPLNRAGEVS